MCVTSTRDIMIQFIFTIIAIIILLPAVSSARMTSENFLIDADSIDAGGGESSSTSYTLNDAFGESVTGHGTSTNFQELEFIASYLFRVLTITAPSTAVFTEKTVSASVATSTGTIAGVEVIDDGTAGWSATMTSQHFTSTSTVKLLSGSNGTVTFTGRYDGLDGILSPIGTFIVEITTGGVVGVAAFKWTDPIGNETTGVTTAADVALSNSITVQFGTATYAVGDRWSIGVDVFPYTGFQVTPGTITVVNGDTGGVTAGSVEYLSGSGTTSDAKTLMTGSSNNSTGTYQQDEELELQIHINSLQGNFTADAVLTII